jgi:uncharacterized phage protein (TIGR01671 family)
MLINNTMRNTLYRGKVYSKNRRTEEYHDCGWVYGDFYRYYNGSLHSTITNIDDEQMQSNEYSVELNTVGEWTGLLDKNGKKIFEGDLLIDRSVDHDGQEILSYYPVVYDVKTASYCVDNSYYKNHSNLVNMVDYFGIENLEVGGNIHDNPELLPKESAPNKIEDEDGLPF